MTRGTGRRVRSAALLSVLAIWGCGSTAVVRAPSSVPDWVERTPIEPGRLYAVGMVGRTLFSEDGRRNAADAARKELARSLSSRIESVLLHIERTRRPGFLGEAGIVSATSWATDLVVNGSQIREYWVDSKGLVPEGESGATYALAVIELATVPADLQQRAPEALSGEEDGGLLPLVEGEGGTPR